MSRGNLKTGRIIAQDAFIIVLIVGIVDVIASSLVSSVALLADGIQSIATSLIFLIIWVGIGLSGRSPDGTFHFGYYRIEALGSLIAAFVLSIFGGFILFEAYNTWITPKAVANAETAILVAVVSTVVVLAVSIKVNKSAKNIGSTALRVGWLSGVLDALASVAVLIGVSLNTYGVLHADSVAGILIAGAIFIGAYSIFKEASLVLVDACNCGDMVGAIGELAKSIKGVKEVHSIRLRKVGPYLTGDMHVVVSSEMIVREADQVATDVEEKVKTMFDKILDFKIRIESDETHSKHSREIEIKKT